MTFTFKKLRLIKENEFFFVDGYEAFDYEILLYIQSFSN